MLARILLDPAATDAAGGSGGGGTASSVTPVPTPTGGPAATVTTPPPAQATAVPTPPMVPLTVEEYQRLRETERQLAEFRAEQQKAIDAKEAERLRALADKEGADKALEKQKADWEAKVGEERTRYATLERSYLGEKKTNAIAGALAGRDFVSADAERQVIDLLGPRLESVLDASGKVVVREQATGRPAADVIKEALDSPAYSHFLKPTSRGGAGAVGGEKPPPGTPEVTTYPNLGVQALHLLAANRNPQPGGDMLAPAQGLGLPRLVS